MGLAKDLRSRRKLNARKIEVAAWADPDGQPFAMYCFPITCYDISQLQKKHPKFMENTTISAMIDLIVMKASDEGGERLFTAAEDRMDLMGEETSVISGIAEQMFAEIESVEDQEKN
jgi:hypothetical protein